jgi:hypothetical protein
VIKVNHLKTTVPFAFVTLFLLGFIGTALVSKDVLFTSKITFIPAGLLFVLGVYSRYTKFDQKSFSLTHSINIISAGFTGAVTTYWLTQHMAIPVVISTSLVGLVGYYLAKFLSKYAVADVSPIVYCGAFVGMASAKVLSLSGVSAAGVLAGVLFIFLGNVFNGCGGKLGSIAFTSCAVTVAATYMISGKL